MTVPNFQLKLSGNTAVFIDWANVYGWSKSLNQPVSPQKLFNYLKAYNQVQKITFYFGTDRNKKSQNFIKQVIKIGYKVVTKPVKYILISEIKSKKLYRRKCDFDMEIYLNVSYC